MSHTPRVTQCGWQSLGFARLTGGRGELLGPRQEGTGFTRPSSSCLASYFYSSRERGATSSLSLAREGR